MALKYPDRLESNNPSSYGIVKSIEVSGHKTVNTKLDLLNLADAILSDSKTNSNNDAIGQLWYVYSENCFYQLIDWTNRKSENGWRKVITDISLNNNLESHKSDTNNPHQVTKSQIGLSNVTNDALVKRSEMGANNGVATLDSSGKVVTSLLPSYVNDVLEFDWLSLFPTKGESGKIYIEKQPNTSYRWTGHHYEMIATAFPASELKSGLMSRTDKIQLNLINQETLFHPIININQICPNQGQGDNKDRWLITYAIEAAWNWIKANSTRNIYLSPGLSIMFRSTNVRATNGFDGPFLVFTYTSTNFSENEFKTDSNWCRTLSEADLNYELADSLYDGFLSKTDWTRFNNNVSATNQHIGNYNNPHHINKSQIGLSNVTNDALVKRSEMGANNGVATLDSSGKVVTSLLPSFVDDVLEFESKTAFPATGESGKIYVSLDTNLTYRWGGTEYVEISKSLALGETSSTAYAGNKGKDTTDKLNTHLENYNNPHQVTKALIGLDKVENTSDKEKCISDAVLDALDEKLSMIYLGWRHYPITNEYPYNMIRFNLLYESTYHNIFIDDPNNEAITSCQLPLASTENDGLFSKTDKSKLNRIESGALVNVQSDWNATSGDSFIKNKPTTLAGYGITDAKIDNNGTITLGTVSIEVMTNDEINAMFV